MDQWILSVSNKLFSKHVSILLTLVFSPLQYMHYALMSTVPKHKFEKPERLNLTVHCSYIVC